MLLGWLKVEMMWGKLDFELFTLFYTGQKFHKHLLS